MPLDYTKVRFQHWFKTSICPYAIYADTEALCTKVHTCMPSPEKSGTTIIENQVPCSFDVLLVDRTTGKSHYEFKRDENCIEFFFEWLRKQAVELAKKKQQFKSLIINDEERENLMSKSCNCVICHENLLTDKVIHHDQSSGKIIGAAHNSCNLKLRTQSFTPVFFQNLGKYDSHHLIRYLSLKPKEKLTIVPCTDENYVSFSLHVPVGEYKTKTGETKIKFEEMRFLDSYRFLPDSLDKLTKSISPEDFQNLKLNFPKKSSYFQRKGVYSNSYIDSSEKIKGTNLPAYGADWSNSLSGIIDITYSDYEYAGMIWNEF